MKNLITYLCAYLCVGLKKFANRLFVSVHGDLSVTSLLLKRQFPTAKIWRI
jgi:hypothetical protein